MCFFCCCDQSLKSTCNIGQAVRSVYSTLHTKWADTLEWSVFNASVHSTPNLVCIWRHGDHTVFGVQCTLLVVLWYKDASRRDEVRTLMHSAFFQQESRHIAADTLPTALPHPTSQQLPPSEPHTFPEPEDTTGKARVRKPATSPPSTSQPSATQPSTSSSQSAASSSFHAVSRTTEWRRQKAEGATSVRKVPCCRVCGRPVAPSDHT